jgi:hypothetical protein
MQIHRQEGMASNYDCCICHCPLNYEPELDYVSPGSSNLAVNGTEGLIFYAGYLDCNDIPWYYDENGAAGWGSDDPNIASVDSSGTVTGQSAGTTSVMGEYYDHNYYYNPYDPPYCFDNFAYGSAGATVTLADGTPVITSISPSPWVFGNTYSNSTISGEYFGTSPSVSLSDQTISFSYTPVSDGQISYSATIPATTPSETVTISVTSNGYNGSGFIAPASDPGMPQNAAKPQSNIAPYPVNFHEGGWGTWGCCTLDFTYDWGSSTGNLGDLSQCSLDELVTSQLGTGTQNWPYPMNQQQTYPIGSPGGTRGEGWWPPSGTGDDYVLAPSSFYKPYKAASFTDTQILHYSCPGVKNGSWVTVGGPYKIVRSVAQNNGVWQYTVTKNDGSLTWNLPPQEARQRESHIVSCGASSCWHPAWHPARQASGGPGHRRA